jgi:NAD(P)-dependent dehydrogenase (short-subunit alcohol dehydrogenase family)
MAKWTAADIPDQTGKTELESGRLDLADMGSVHRFAAQILDNQLSPDLLVNNAGVMGVPQRLAPRTDSSCSSAPIISGTSP